MSTRTRKYYSLTSLFPCIWFCKHIGAIYFHFPHLRPVDVPAPSPSEVPNEPQRAPILASSANKFHLLVQDVNTLSNKLISEGTDQSAPSPAVVEAIHSAKASLMAAVVSVQGSSPLPHRETSAPNQHSWTETAERMGTQKAGKRRRLPEEVGLTQKAISIAKGKCHQCDVWLHVRLSVGKARWYEKKRVASDEGEERRMSSRIEWIQEHQARELVCSHYPTYTTRFMATSATTSR